MHNAKTVAGLKRAPLLICTLVWVCAFWFLALPGHAQTTRAKAAASSSGSAGSAARAASGTAVTSRTARGPTRPARALPATPAAGKTGSAAVKPASAKRAPAAAAALTWQLDLGKSLDLARRSGKLVLVDVYTDWCGWCHKLDREVYTDPAVVEFLNERFVLLKIDAEDGGAGQGFAGKYQVRGFPCIMILDGSGQLKGAFYGFRPAADFKDAVLKALEVGADES